MTLKKKIKVLIIDDSALVREILSKGLSSDPFIQVVGAAPDVYTGRDMIVREKPDVLTLDIEMPGMDGLQFLKKLMPQYPLPVVIVSSLTMKGKEVTFQALDFGAVDYVSKPDRDVTRGLDSMMTELKTKIKIASTANLSHWKFRDTKKKFTKSIDPVLNETTDKVIALGASTGGTEAIRKVLENLPPTTPGIVIVQHMPAGFTKTFSDRLNGICRMQVKEAETGDRIIRGRVLIAPGDFHLKVFRSGGQYRVECFKGDKVNGHRPSIDIMMMSVASCAGANAFGIILTGMGGDGAKGLKAMKEAGAGTIGQDRVSSVVYGMPRVAYDIGAVDIQLHIDDIARGLIRMIKEKSKK